MSEKEIRRVLKKIIDDYDALETLHTSGWLKSEQYDDVCERMLRNTVAIVKEVERCQTQEQ